MNDSTPIEYIVIPRAIQRPVRIDAILEARLKEFLLSRQRQLWREEGV